MKMDVGPRTPQGQPTAGNNGQDSAPAAAAPEQEGVRGHAGMSLKAKGIVALVVFAVYAVLVGVFTNIERQKLFVLVEDLELAHRAEEQLVQINMSMARTLLAVNIAFSAENPTVAAPPAAIEVEATRSLLDALEASHPRVLMLSHKLQALVNDMVRAPGRGVLALTRGTLHELITELDSITQSTRAHKISLLANYRVTYDRVTLQGLAFSVLGIILVGAATAIFFSRLTWDIRKLESRALEIIEGYRGAPLDVTRRDEVGSLMRAVNRLQQDLRERERNLELARQQQFHREKMAAVGSLAAQLAHEINNPIAAISGVASSILSIRDERHCCPSGNRACQPDLILQQTRRITQITRQIADFTRPQAASAELVDLNQLVHSTCDFVAYDRRFRGLAITTELDGDLPAVRVVADHVCQVLMNLLINAADALEGVPPESGAIRVTTREDGAFVTIDVHDNGKGMTEETLAHVFDEYFTTKATGAGTGLGLALSRELIQQGGGTLALESAPGVGTHALIRLPVRGPAQPPNSPSTATT